MHQLKSDVQIESALFSSAPAVARSALNCRSVHMSSCIVYCLVCRRESWLLRPSLTTGPCQWWQSWRVSEVSWCSSWPGQTVHLAQETLYRCDLPTTTGRGSSAGQVRVDDTFGFTIYMWYRDWTAAVCDSYSVMTVKVTVWLRYHADTPTYSRL